MCIKKKYFTLSLFPCERPKYWNIRLKDEHCFMPNSEENKTNIASHCF